MPGLDPGIHVFLCAVRKDVDGGVKPGHGEEKRIAQGIQWLSPKNWCCSGSVI